MGDQREQESADQDPGTVISQSPGAGETQRLDTTVTLVIATAPPTPTTPVETTPAPTDTGLPTVPPAG